jgi:hypothetical protein
MWISFLQQIGGRMVVRRDADIQDRLRGQWLEHRDESLKDFLPDRQQQTGN